MAPRILGQDGQFHIERNAMGVPGLHVAVNVFDSSLHKRLFHDAVFTTNANNSFVADQEKPLSQCILHPTRVISSPWPDDWHRLINAVRDSGLYESATIPDNAYALTYFPQSHFPCHHDGRAKWGEYIICVSLGSPCTLTFQHGAPKTKKPMDPTKPWNYVPPPPPEQNAYWTRSQTEQDVKPYKRRLWQVTMTLPPNSMYVMSGASRYDWLHGINVDPLQHKNDSSAALIPSWNTTGNRRAVIFRSTKVFSDVSLQLEYQRAVMSGDCNASTASLEQRVLFAKQFKPQDDFCRTLEPHEIQQLENQARILLTTLQRSGVHRLRFEPCQVKFHSERGNVRAVADHTDDVVAADVGEGHRLGGARQANNTRKKEPEIVVIDEDSCEDNDEEALSLQNRKRPAETTDVDTTNNQDREALRKIWLERFDRPAQDAAVQNQEAPPPAKETTNDGGGSEEVSQENRGRRRRARHALW